MRAELGRAERRVEEQSVALKKPLGLGDLVLTQIVFVVGSGWVGTAAKLGTSHLFFWLLAILLFYFLFFSVFISHSLLFRLRTTLIESYTLIRTLVRWYAHSCNGLI